MASKEPWNLQLDKEMLMAANNDAVKGIFSAVAESPSTKINEIKLLNMKKSQLQRMIKEELRRVLKENSYLMQDPAVKSKVEMVINTLKSIDVDGETMQYILQQVGMDDQMKSQLSPMSEDTNEATLNNFTPSQRMASLPRPFAELLPTTAKTIAEATERINQFKGKNIAMHARYFVVKPKEGTTVALFEDRLLYFGQSEYHMPGMRGMQEQVKVNVTELTIRDITDVPQGQSWTVNKDKVVELGRAYVNTDVFLKECQELFTIVKQGS